MNKKLLLIAGGLVVSLGAGGAAYAFGLFGSKEIQDADAQPEVVVVPEQKALFYNVPPLVVSAQYNGSLRYLQVKLSILTRSELTYAKLEANTPLIQDSLIMLLDSFSFHELEDSKGKEMLRAQVEEKVRGLIKDEGVESVLFTGFVIQ